MIGNDARVFLQHNRRVDVRGIDNHEVSDLKIVDASAKVMTNVGEVILILSQYAYLGVGRSIHSSGQIEANENFVDDKSMKVGGRQYIKTLEGVIIPLDIVNGLPYMKMHPHTDDEWNNLRHVRLTAATAWDPKSIDNNLTDQEDWQDILKDLEDGVYQTPFDEFGNYKKRQVPEPVVILPPVGEEEENSVQADEITNEDLEINHVNVEDMSWENAFKDASDLNKRFLVSDIEIEAHKEPRQVKPAPIDYEKWRPYFLHAKLEKVRKTFENTTQFSSNVLSGRVIQQTLKSPYPAHNVWRRNEPVATDTVFAEVPAVDSGGQTMAQGYVGRISMVIDIYGMNTEAEFVNTLEDHIRERGAPDKLISDSARVEMSKRVKDILRSLQIKEWQSEPNYQHQNFFERRWQQLKHNVNWIMNWRNVDENAWLLCSKWVADVMNHTAEESLGWKPPLEKLTGQTVDISVLLCFMFWDVVYVKRYKDENFKDQIGSKKTNEIRGRFVGFAWSVGHALTFKVLTDDTKKVICRSQIRLAKDGENNLKLDTRAEGPTRIHIKSKRDSLGETIPVTDKPFSDDKEELKEAYEKDIANDPDLKTPMNTSRMKDTQDEPFVETVEGDDDEDDDKPPLKDNVKERLGKDKPRDFRAENLKTPNPTVKGLSPEDMIGRTFLMPPEEDHTRHRAKIIGLVEDYKKGMDEKGSPWARERIKFKCLVNDDYEDIVSYNDIVDYIEEDQTWDGIWKFRRILKHKKVSPKDPDYNKSQWNILIEWEGGETSWEPLAHMVKQDPVTVAIYAREHKLLNVKGWGYAILKKYGKTAKRMIRRANQAKLHSFRTKPIYMFGVLVPRNHAQAMQIDEANKNTKWRDAELLELSQVDEYDTFKDMGEGHDPGRDYTKINVHFVYAVKHDGRHKARLVAGGHLTETPIDSVYSSVVSLRGIRMLAFIGELNDLEVWGTDIGNAYLESFTKEKVYIIAGPEFGEREGHTLIIVKALYGLISSSLRWSERLSDVLRDMGFFPSKAERDIWMRDKGDHYEYIAVYVDDLMILSRDPQGIIDSLEKEHNFKLKGTGPVSFHLGCDFLRDDEGVLCLQPKKYIEKMEDNYQRIFGTKPKPATSPLVKGDHPELDTSELLDDEKTKLYQSLIGALQWVIQIGRFDVAPAVMTMSRFRAMPREGHLDRVKRIFGYLSKMRHGKIRILTDEPDYSDIPVKEYDWQYTVYGDVKEQIPSDAPEPKGKPVRTTSYVDANLYHDLISGKSVTGILHLLNKTPVDWFSKLQATVETATFGSEFVGTKTCTDQIVDIRLSLRYLGVPLAGASYMFGDNESVVNASSMPQGKLHKRHNALAYHRTREAIAAGFVRYYHVKSEMNAADILSKHWDMPSVYKTLKPLLFWHTDTAELGKDVSTMEDNVGLNLPTKVLVEGSVTV